MNFIPEKKLGFGLMRLPHTDPDDRATIDMEKVKQMVDLFMEKGFTYFDTAWLYNNFNSENSVRECIVNRYPRDSFTVATKLHCGFVNSFEDRDKVFNEQLKKTGAGYFDYYLLHGIEAEQLATFEKFDCFNWLLDKKKAGLVKHAGFSYHDNAELLEDILLAHPEMEFVQLQINYLDWESEWIQSRKCYEVCVKYNKPIIVMEPVKGGTLSKIPSEAEAMLKEMDPSMSVSSWAIRYAASLPGVMQVLSGMSNIEQMQDNLSYMWDFKPLTDKEKEVLYKVADIINSQIAVPCTGCSYCTAGCPANIAIPQYFSLYNEDMRENPDKGWTINFTNYGKLTKNFGAAKDCIACGQCEGVCPQHLPIIDKLKEVSTRYDR